MKEREIAMEKRKWKYIIGIVILVLLSVFVLAGCKRKQDKEQENTGVEENLQVEEDGEGESATFEEIFSTESEENKTDTGTSSVTEQNKPSSPDKEKEDSNKQNNNEQNAGEKDTNEQNPNEQDNNKNDASAEKEHITGEEEDTEEGWGPII